MPPQGQVSVDFLFVVLALLTTLLSLQTIASTVAATQAEAAVYQQEHRLALALARLLGTGAGFTDGAATLTFTAPPLLVPGKSAPLPCKVDVDAANARLTVSVELAGQTLERSAPFQPPPNLSLPGPFPAPCGQPVTVNYA